MSNVISINIPVTSIADKDNETKVAYSYHVGIVPLAFRAPEDVRDEFFSNVGNAARGQDFTGTGDEVVFTVEVDAEYDMTHTLASVENQIRNIVISAIADYVDDKGMDINDVKVNYLPYKRVNKGARYLFIPKFIVDTGVAKRVAYDLTHYIESINSGGTSKLSIVSNVKALVDVLLSKSPIKGSRTTTLFNELMFPMESLKDTFPYSQLDEVVKEAVMLNLEQYGDGLFWDKEYIPMIVE